MPNYSPLDLLVAGMLSHGFREESPEGEERRFTRFGRDDRLLREADSRIRYRDPKTGEIPLTIPEGSDYHQLLRKCGQIWLRTRERNAEREIARKRPQRELPLPNADEMLDQMIGGSP